MKKVLFFLGVCILAFIAGVTVVVASQSSYTANAFSQFCAANPSICTKVDFTNARIGTVSCPSTNQIINTMYVHAGNGQTVWELPDGKFTYSYSNVQNTVTVTALQGTHDISWIGVTCSTVTITPTPTNTPTPTSTPTPTITATVTPTPTTYVDPTSTPTPTPTGSQTCDECGGTEIETTPTATPTNTPTPSDPTATPTPGSSNTSSSNSTSSNTSTGQVLGTAIGGPTTLAATGTAVDTMSITSFILGILSMTAGVFNHAKKTHKS